VADPPAAVIFSRALAVAEDLDERVLAHRALGHQLVDTDRTALRE
jgi:hypothetical protein